MIIVIDIKMQIKNIDKNIDINIDLNIDINIKIDCLCTNSTESLKFSTQISCNLKHHFVLYFYRFYYITS